MSFVIETSATIHQDELSDSLDPTTPDNLLKPSGRGQFYVRNYIEGHYGGSYHLVSLKQCRKVEALIDVPTEKMRIRAFLFSGESGPAFEASSPAEKGAVDDWQAQLARLLAALPSTSFAAPRPFTSGERVLLQRAVLMITQNYPKTRFAGAARAAETQVNKLIADKDSIKDATCWRLLSGLRGLKNSNFPRSGLAWRDQLTIQAARRFVEDNPVFNEAPRFEEYYSAIDWITEVQPKVRKGHVYMMLGLWCAGKIPEDRRWQWQLRASAAHYAMARRAFLEEEIQRTLGRLDREKRWHILRALAARPQSLIRHLLPTPLSHLRRKGILLKKGYKRLVWKFAMRYYGNQLLAAYVRRWSEEIPPIARRGKNIIWGRKQYVDVAIRAIERGLAYDWLSLSSYKGQKNDPDKRLLYKAYMALAKQRSMEKKGRRPPPFRSLDELMKYAQKLVESQPSSSSPIETSSQGGKDMEWTPEEIEERWTAACNLAAIGNTLGPGAVLFISRHPELGFFLEYLIASAEPEGEGLYLSRTFVHQARLASEGLGFIAQRHPVTSERTLIIHSRKAGIVERSIAERRTAYRAGRKNELVILEPPIGEIRLSWFTAWMKQQIKSGDYNSDQQDVFVVEKIDQALQTYFDFLAASSPLASDGNRRTLGTAAHSVYGWRRLPLADTDARMLGTALQDVTRRQSSPVDARGKRGPPYDWLRKVGRRLERARKIQGISRKEFMAAMGVPEATAINYEHGHTNSRVSRWRKVESLLGISLRDLFDLSRPVPLRQTTVTADSPFPIMEIAGRKGYHTVVALARALKRDEVGLWALLKRAEEGSAGIGTLYELMRETEDLPVAPRLIRKKVSLPKPLSPEMKKLKFWLKIKKNVREGRKASRAEQVRDNFRVMKIHRPRHARVFSIYVGLSGRKRQTITYMAEHWRKIDPEAGQCSVTRALVWEMLDDARLMLLGEKKMLYRLSKQRRISSAVISQEKNQNRGAGVYKYCELKGGKVELKTGHLRFRGDKVVAKVLLSGICRADVKEIANSRTIIGKRPLFGHELVGEIVHVGDNARLSEGQRVVFNPNITNKRSTGFAEYLFIDSAAADEALIPIPERMRLTAAVLLEPFSCVLRSIEKLMEHMNRKNLKGLEVAIIGLGNAGSCFAILAKEFKAQRVAAFNMRDRRIPFAVKKGIIAKKDAFYLERTDEFKDKFDAVIVVPTKIDENILNKAVNLARKKGGYIHVYGGTMPREQLKVNFRQKDVCLQKGVYLHTLRIRERCQEVILGDKKIKLSGAYGTKTKNFLKAMGLAGRLEIEKTISGFITLDNLPEFISDMNSGKKDPVGKILVRVADASSPAASQEEDRKKVSVERKSLEWKKNRADWNWQAVIKIRYDGRRPGTLRDIAKETSKRGINIRYTDVRGEQAGKRVRTVTVEARRKKTIVELEKELALIEDYKDEEYERLAKHKWALEAEVLDRPSSLKEVAEICANMKIKMSECYQPEPPAGAKNATIVSELDVPEGADIEKLKVLLSGVVERLEIESGGLLNLIVMRFHKELYELMGTVEPWERRYIPRIVKLIAERHLGELRKDKRSIFVSHQLRGLKILVKEGQDNRPLDIFCYLLHDVIESGDATSWQLCEEFGAGVADIVWLLTREGKKTFDSEAVSLRKIVKKLLTETGKRGRLVSSISFCLKLVDRIDSLRTLEGTPRGFPAHIVFTTLNPFIHCLEPIKLGDIDARVRPVVERLLTLLYRETLLRCREFGFLDEEGNIIEKQFKRYRNAAIKAGELTKANMHDCTYEEYNSIIIKLLQFEKSTQPSVAGESSPKAGSPVERSAAEGVILPIQDEIDAFVKWFNSLLVRETWHLKGLRIDLAAGKNPESPNAFIFDDQQASVVINLGAMSEMKALYPLMDEIVSLWFTCEMERHSRDIWSGPEIAEITDAWHEWAEEVVYPLIPETEILGRKVIDIGTGTGHLPFYLEKKGASEAWGVDISSELIRRAQAAARQAGSKAVFLHGNAARLPQIPDGYFDTAACISSLSFMPHHIRSLVLKEIFRILKPDGRLYIFVYFTEYNTHRPRIDPRMHWTHEQWPRNLEKAGFVNVQPKSVVTNIVMSIPSYGALFISADKPEHVLQAASSPAMKSHPGSVIHSKLPQSHSRGVMGPSLSRRAFISRSLLGAAGLYLSSVYPQAWAPFQLQKPFPRLDDIWREILIHYNVFPGAKSHPKIIHEAVVNHYLYRAVAQHLGHAYYEPPAGLQGNGYFSDLMKGINKIYGDEVLVVDGHLNKVKPLHYGKFKNASRQLMLFFREKDSTYIALVNPKGQVEFNTHQNGISDFLDSDKAVVVEFGAMSDFFKLTQAEFEKKTGELDTLLRWFVEQYPDYKNRTAVFTPGHGGLEFKTTHYVTLKFKRHSRGIFMLWPASLTGKSHSRGVMGADASATKRGGSARHYGVPLRFPVGYVMFSSDNKGKTYGSSPVDSKYTSALTVLRPGVEIFSGLTGVLAVGQLNIIIDQAAYNGIDGVVFQVNELDTTGQPALFANLGVRGVYYLLCDKVMEIPPDVLLKLDIIEIKGGQYFRLSFIGRIESTSSPVQPKKLHSRGVMGADASATKRGGSAKHYGVPLRFPVGYVMFSSDNKGKTYGSSPVESRGPAQTLQITITDEEDGIKKMVINGTHEYVVRMSDVENGLAYNLGAVRANRVDEGSVISLIMFLAVLPFLYYSLIRTDEMVRTDYWNEQDPVDAGFEADPYEKMSIHYVAEVMVRNNSVHLRDWFGSHYAIDLTSGEMLIPRDSIGEIFVHPEKVLVPLAMMPYLFGKAAREETARCIEKRYKSVGDAKFSAEKAIFDALKEVVQNPTSSPVWNNQKNSGEPLEIIYVTNNKYQPFENGGLLKAELGVCIAVLDAGGMAHISPTTGHNAEDAPTLPEKKQKFLTRLLAHVGETKDSSIAIISSVQLERTMPIERDHIISVEDIMMFLLYQKKIDRSRILPIIGEAPKDVYLGANGRIRIVYYRGLDIYDEDIVSLFSSTPCNHGDLKDCSSEDFITSSPVGEAGYSGKRIERSHPGSVIFPEMLQSHSRGVIYLTFVPWSVHAVPERRAVPERERVEIFITPIEERTMKEEVLYLFWRAPSLLSRLWKWLKGFFEPMNAWFKDISRRGPLLSFRHPEHPLFLISEEMGTKDLDYHVEILPRQRSMAGQNDGGISSVNNPVGAVVASSAIVVDPTKGDPNDPVWRHFYENKLNPLTPRHDVYFPQFVQNFMDPSRADWHAFRQEIEADQNSPWQAVLVEVRKMEAGQHKSVEAAAPVPEKKPIEIIQPVVKTPESFWQGVREVPSIVRRWAGYTEVPVGIKTTIENVGENMVKVLLSDLESFEGMIRRLFPGFLSWFYRMGDWIARILVISKDVFIPIEYAPALASGLVINRGQVLKHLSPVNKAAVVAASSSPANDNSLKDPT